MSVKRLLAGLGKRAEAVGADAAGRAEIARAVTKQVVVHRASGNFRLEVISAFGRAAIPAAMSWSAATAVRRRHGSV